MAKRKRARRNAVPKPSKNSKSSKSLKEPIDYNQVLFLSSVIAFLAIVFLLVAFNSSHNFTGNAVVPITGADTTNNIYVSGGDWHGLVQSSGLADGLTYVFGQPIQFPGFSSQVSGIIVTIAVWLLFFFTFSDIISTFTSFGRMGRHKKWIPWAIGFLISLIAANIGFIVKFAVWATAIFAFAGTIAVYIALGAALVAFLAVNLGLSRLGSWLMKRNAMMLAAESRSGGTRLAGAVAGFGEVGKALEHFGEQ